MTKEEKKALKEQKKAEKLAKKEAKRQENIKLEKYYFLATVYAVVSVEAEDESDAREKIDELKPRDFVNFKLKKAKLIKPSLYQKDDEDEEEVEEEKPKKKGLFGRKKKSEEEEAEAPEE